VHVFRKSALSVLCLVVFLAAADECFAKSRMAKARTTRLAPNVSSLVSGGAGSGGLFARLNKPLVPRMPGLPTVSPLGLIAPRLSNVVLLGQLGGLRTPAGRLSGLGILAPRVSPLIALFRTPPKTPQARFAYGLSIISPRAMVLVGMLQAARGAALPLR
jgi:hypothetical protein